MPRPFGVKRGDSAAAAAEKCPGLHLAYVTEAACGRSVKIQSCVSDAFFSARSMVALLNMFGSVLSICEGCPKALLSLT